MTSSTTRLGRLLNLVPYLLTRPGITIVEAACDLGVTERQLREDLQLLWLCGLPGYGPGDLIDMAFDGDRVTITYDAGVNRPLKLTPNEALSLVVALRLLRQTPGMAQSDAIDRALAKLGQAAGPTLDTPVTVGQSGHNDRMEDLRRAVEERKSLRITYYTASRDAASERTIDPMRVLVIGDRGYLEAWCRKASAVRLFRVDRIDACVETGDPSEIPEGICPINLKDGVFQPSPQLPLITLHLTRGARWIIEYYPCEEIRRESGDMWVVSLRVVDLAWAARLVLGLGPEVRVVGPCELAEMVIAQTSAALEAYEVSDGHIV